MARRWAPPYLAGWSRQRPVAPVRCRRQAASSSLTPAAPGAGSAPYLRRTHALRSGARLPVIDPRGHCPEDRFGAVLEREGAPPERRPGTIPFVRAGERRSGAGRRGRTQAPWAGGPRQRSTQIDGRGDRRGMRGRGHGIGHRAVTRPAEVRPPAASVSAAVERRGSGLPRSRSGRRPRRDRRRRCSREAAPPRFVP